MRDKAARNEAYRRGDFTDCREKPHSAGRPRCDSCHQVYAIGGTTNQKGE